METGLVPKASYKKLIKLFAQAIAHHHEINDAESAIKGRVSDLEALSNRSLHSLFQS